MLADHDIDTLAFDRNRLEAWKIAPKPRAEVNSAEGKHARREEFIFRQGIVKPNRTNVNSRGSQVGGEKPAAEDGPLTSDFRPPTSKLTLANAEREHILVALREIGWVVGGPKGAAARLGVKRSMLYWKMKKLGISRPE